MNKIPLKGLKADDFAIQSFDIILDHFKRREKEERVLSIIGAGAAFEEWMSFESRLALERARGKFFDIGIDLTENITSPDSERCPIPRYWTENEYGKVDLLIGENQGMTTTDKKLNGNEGAIAFEFKLIYNNKNWQRECDSLWTDIIEPRDDKITSKLDISLRFGIVAEVFKLYPKWILDEGSYPGQKDNLENWRMEMLEYLCTKERGKRLYIMKTSREPDFKINDPYLKGNENFIRFHLVKAE